MTSESINYDILIIGGGPAGLACAIAAKEKNPKMSVMIVEKGACFGAHGVSGAIVETDLLNEWMPEWNKAVSPVSVRKNRVFFLTKEYALPLPGTGFSNKDNKLISIGKLLKFMADKAEKTGVDLIPGTAASDLILSRDETELKGAKLIDGTEVHAKTTVFAEGACGYLSEKAIYHFDLRLGTPPETYALGIKESWEIPPSEKIKDGDIHHFMGWPLELKTYGGGFLHAFSDTKIAIGLTVSLDYRNPTLDPFMEMQRFKTHPFIQPVLKGGRRTGFAARTMTEGGYQALPEIAFKGGIIIGDSAGLVNVPKIKGIHNALRMGKMVGENLAANRTLTLDELKASEVGKDLWQVRNVRPAFQNGFLYGLTFAGINNYALKGRFQPTMEIKDDTLKPIGQIKPIEYAKPDGITTFDKISSVSLANLSVKKSDGNHLKVKDKNLTYEKMEEFGAFDTRYCPAEVYSLQGKELKTNPENCLHCKTCCVKSLMKNIEWTPPKNTGPNYNDM